jgi:lysozyme
MGKVLAAALAAVAIMAAGCGGQPPSHPVPQSTAVVVSPESARTPEGAIPALPPPAPPTRSLRYAKHIDGAGLRLIERFEGYSRCAYWDPYGRVWTAGFGQTRGAYAGFCFTGVAAAEANLRRSVESEYEWAIRALGFPFNEHEWDGLCSFAYNLGAGIFTGVLRYDLERGRVYAATRIMLQYDHAGGVVLPGLATRRADEVRLILTPEPKPVSFRPALLHRRAVLRRDLTRHRCRVAPYHGRGRYHAICARWLREGAQVNRGLTQTSIRRGQP